MPGLAWPTAWTSRTVGPTCLTHSTSPRTSLLRRSRKAPTTPMRACSGSRRVEREPHKGKSPGRALALNPNYAFAYGTRGLDRSLPRSSAGRHSAFSSVPYASTRPSRSNTRTSLVRPIWWRVSTTPQRPPFRERIRLTPTTDLSRALLASALGHLGAPAEARRVWHELKDVSPRYSFEERLARLPFQNQADGDKTRQGLARAGHFPRIDSGKSFGKQARESRSALAIRGLRGE